jgi:capsular polysaccharide biosynthesis protein
MLRALVRFWWVTIVGLVLTAVVFIFATYTVQMGAPPKLTARAKPTYSASTQLLITSKGEPYLSATNVNAKIIKLTDGSTASTGATGTTGATAATSTYDSGSGADGDLQRLVEIANDLPPRVTSDTVIRLRNKLFRRIDGSVTAVNPYAFSGAGGFREGPLPFIQVTGTANSPQDAVDITNETATAFKQWFEGRQNTNKIKPNDRVVVEQVNTASNATAAGGAKPILGIAAALLVLLGTAGFVLALERLIPRRSRRAKSAGAVSVPALQEIPIPVPAREIREPHEPREAREPHETDVPAPLEVPTMTFGAQVEDAVTGEDAKPAPRPRKQPAKNGSAPRRRRTGSSPRVAPTSDDAS